ncbi:uncharacterized protein F5Z01DRAFT_674418 [Emericellopsis atlantica]|uniref:Uncharacterized protein n=1 Tax=Emericellopsis atlantica TaxID=2614577 RepID=A0A9P7ZLW0_9HYPO|nr:uncharacterized protein F5Z01DRAFT_674418 [Emericellopsis atlantica]KAG9254102.1 hypothetical protein F5Z01DRAFT_674418 [Emericellopsis atlantica]
MITSQLKSVFEQLRERRKTSGGVLDLLDEVLRLAERFERKWDAHIANNKLAQRDAGIFKRFFGTWEDLDTMITTSLDDARSYLRRANKESPDVVAAMVRIETIWESLKALHERVHEEIEKLRGVNLM